MKASLYFRAKDYNRKITREVFYYYRCSSCCLIFLSPIPDDLGRYYPDNYYSIPTTLEQVASAAEYERYKIDIVTHFARGGRLLEIGPAYGAFLYLAKEAGFEAEAIEMDPHCCRFMEEVVGVKTIRSNDPISALAGIKKYNVITLWHVIEHLRNPWDALRAFADSLLPGGILLIAAPNPDSFQFKVLGRYWPHVDAPRHIELIPSSLLSRQIKLAGLEVLWSTTKDKGAEGWNVFGWQYFLTNFVCGSDSSFLKQGMRFVGNITAKVLSPLEHIEGRGSAYTVVYRKGVE